MTWEGTILLVRGGPGTGKAVVARLAARERAQLDSAVLMAPTNETSNILPNLTHILFYDMACFGAGKRRLDHEAKA